MKKNQNGFVHLLLFLIIIIAIAVIGFVGWRILRAKPKADQNNRQLVDSSIAEQPLALKSISFNLDYYNPTTNHAGDMVFNHEDHDLSGNNHLIFADFGTQDYRSPTDPTKRNPQPTFILPLGTKVHSLVDGVVVDVKDLYSNDQTIWVARDASSRYIYETEHIINPVVKKGDKVTGGEIIGEVSSHDSEHHPGFGIVEIGILYTKQNYPQHLCPFHYLDPSIKSDIDKKILSIHQAWEKYLGMPNLYDDANSAEPGCFSLDPVKG